MYFEIGPAEGFEWVFVCNSDDRGAFEQLDGTPRRETWVPIRVTCDKPDEHLRGRPADFPWFDHGLAMRTPALEALRDILTPNGESLPLETDDGGELFVFNARVLAALDEESSEIWRFPGSHRIMHVKTPVLTRSALQGVDIFRLPHPSSSTYVSDPFVKIVSDAHLHGLKFRPVLVR